MKIIIAFTFFLFLLFISSSAQTLEAYSNKVIDSKIKTIEAEIQQKTEYIAKLRAKYTPEYYLIKKTEAELEDLKDRLTKLNLDKKNLVEQQFFKSLPNNQIDLLKIIISQNQKIIELLEERAKPQ